MCVCVYDVSGERIYISINKFLSSIIIILSFSIIALYNESLFIYINKAQLKALLSSLQYRGERVGVSGVSNGS